MQVVVNSKLLALITESLELLRSNRPGEVEGKLHGMEKQTKERIKNKAHPTGFGMPLEGNLPGLEPDLESSITMFSYTTTPRHFTSSITSAYDSSQCFG